VKTCLFDSSMNRTLEEAVDLLGNILEASAEYSTVGAAMDGTIVLWSAGAHRMYGYEADEVVGKLNGSLLHAPEEVLSGKLSESVNAAIEEGKWEGTRRRIRRNGEHFTARMIVRPRLDSSGKAIGYLMISTDISEELRHAAQLESTYQSLREQVLLRQNAESALLQAHREVIVRAKEVEQTTSQVRHLAEMSDLLQSCGSSDEAHQVAQRALQQFFPEEAGIIYLSGQPGSSLETFASWNSANLMSSDSFEPQQCWALRRGRPHVIGIDSAAIRCAHVKERKQGGSICIPMVGQGQSFGVFHLAWAETNSEEHPHRREDREKLATAVADIIALAVSNVRLREALKDQTIRDPMTGLYNRRYLEDSLHREVCRARRSGASIGIIMIDIDNFKLFNDSFGHPMGDQLLRALGTYLKVQVRPEDIPSRYGGEEFTLVLPGASREIIRARAEKLRKGFRNLPLNFGVGLVDAVETLSLSLGVAIFPEHGDSANGVLKAADRALYEAKKTGKDRVVFAQTDVPTETSTQECQA
jgi:diguanylate cyclase (GGDEF)-like protein/PAS domain S-box-containing protein